MMTRRMRWWLPASVLVIGAAEASATNSAFWSQYELLVQAAQARQWREAVHISLDLECRYAAEIQDSTLDGIPLGVYTAYQRGRALRRIGEDMPGAHAALRRAAGLLQMRDVERVCSGAWRDVTYELGMVCARLGRWYDADRWLAASAQMTATQSVAWLRAQLALIEVEWARGRTRAARTACRRLWYAYTAPSRTLTAYYAYALLVDGERSEAMRVALNGLAEFGVSSQALDQDLLLMTALMARDDTAAQGTAELYDLLGLQLETVQLRGGMEPLCALLINQRALLAQCYPELKKPRDMERLRQRCAFARAEQEWASGDEAGCNEDDEW